MIKLTPKQEKFALEYVKLGNASKAYRVAYNASKMNSNTIARKAQELLKHPKVSIYIDKLQEEIREKSKIDIERVIQEIAKVAFFDIRELFNEDGSLKSVKEVDEKTAKAISEITSNIAKSEDNEITEVVKYKMHDKTKALDMLMRHLGGYNKDNSQKITSIIVKVAGDNESE